MSMEISDFTTLVDDAAVAELAAKDEAITAAVRQVEQEHPGFSYSYSTEIRCNAWGCSRFSPDSPRARPGGRRQVPQLEAEV